MRRILGGLTAVVLTLGVIVLPSASTAAGASPVADEALFVGKLNALRTAKGLAPLSVDSRLTASARAWAQRMAARGDIFHNMNLPNEAPAEWQRVGENVGVANLDDDEVGAVEAIHRAFVASPTHYKNLVGRYNRIGVGVVFANGQVFVAQHFMQVDPARKSAAGATKKATTAPPRRRHGWMRRAA